ncbi:MAG TPA: hypothetical protein VJL89_02095 [Thermodesulfovibrionia bacterium]|nr:hypothetical protein [Thermodesulfovibrionia bacterium]
MSPPTVSCTSISRAVKDASDCSHIPMWAAFRRWDMLLAQSLGNPIKRNGSLRVSVPGENLFDNLSFDRVDLHSTWVAWLLRVKDVAIRA